MNQAYPEANLLPPASDDLEAARQTAVLAFFSATVHPLVTRIAMPMKFIADDQQAFDLIRPKGTEAMNPVMAMIDHRLADRQWWYRDTWSVVDRYLFWAWSRITGVGFPDDPFPNIRDHAERSLQRPAVVRSMEREAVHIEQLKAEGVYRAPR